MFKIQDPAVHPCCLGCGEGPLGPEDEVLWFGGTSRPLLPWTGLLPCVLQGTALYRLLT